MKKIYGVFKFVTQEIAKGFLVALGAALLIILGIGAAKTATAINITLPEIEIPMIQIEIVFPPDVLELLSEIKESL